MSERLTAKVDELQFDPIDWQQMRIMAKLTPGERMLAMAQASAFGHALLRGALQTRFPDRSLHEINMMMLRYIEWQREREY